MIIPHSIIADSFRRAGGYFNCLESGEHFISVQRAAVVSSRSDEYRARAAECLERAQEARDFEVKRTADVGSRRFGSILVSREIRVTG